MFKNIMRIGSLVWLFSQVVGAGEFSWPNRYDGKTFEVSNDHTYGCFNMIEEHYLALDFERGLYELTGISCSFGDWYVYGSRGLLTIEGNQAWYTLTKQAYSESFDSDSFQDDLHWWDVEPWRAGYFMRDAEAKGFDEFDADGKFVRHW